MRNRSKVIFTGIAAAMLLSLAVSSASANRFSISNTNFRVTWASLELAAAGQTVRCPVTLEGSFHSRTISKVANALIGYVTRAIVNGSEPPCTGGVATILRETLPWHITYNSFTGTLPNISRITINLINASFRVDPTGAFFPACLARTTTTNPARGFIELTAGTITGLTADSSALIPLSGGFGCEIAGEGRFTGTGRVTLLGNTTAIRVTLI